MVLQASVDLDEGNCLVKPFDLAVLAAAAKVSAVLSSRPSSLRWYAHRDQIRSISLG